MLPRDPVTAELIESRWLVGQLAGLGGAATFRVDGVSRAMAPWSPAMARLHGVPVDAAAATVAEYCARFVHPGDRSGVQRNADFALRHPETDFDLEYSIVRADGDRRLRAVLRAFAAERADAVLVGAVQDVTEGVLRYREPLASQGRLATLTRLAVIGEMASGLAHELNQPLTALANYAAAASRLARGGSDVRLQAALDGVAFEANRAAGVIHRVRRFAHVQLGEVVPTDLNALLRETLPLLEPLSRQHGVSLRLDPDLRLPVVQVDPVAMQLAVINLACNAIEASAATKVPRLAVDLATRVTADGVEIVVRDRGVGLPQAAVDQCFIPLYSSKPSAPGLGLSISEAIARQHAGRVTLEPNPDGGVTARLSVPCADPARGDVTGEP